MVMFTPAEQRLTQARLLRAVAGFALWIACGCSESHSQPGVKPLIMLLVDTSASMELKPSCDCTTPSCQECLPDCDRAERSNWNALLEILTGSFHYYGCRVVER